MKKKTGQLQLNNDGSIHASVEVVLVKEGKQFVAYCPALELSSYGDTEAEAHAAFDEAMEIFISETTQKGSLEKFLLRLGWTLRKQDYTPPTLSSQLLNLALKPKAIQRHDVAFPT